MKRKKNDGVSVVSPRMAAMVATMTGAERRAAMRRIRRWGRKS